MSHAPPSVCILPVPPPNAARAVSYPDYVQEILAHAGLCYQTVYLEELPDRLESLRLLLTIGEAKLPEGVAARLTSWVEAGGLWVSVGGLCGLPELWGAHAEPPSWVGWGGGIGTLGEGYLIPSDASHSILSHLRIPLHYFNGIPIHADQGIVLARVLDAHQRETNRAALVEHRVGQGRCLLIAPDLIGTIVRIQQGIAVTRDGVSAPDGSAPIADDVLKSGDGGVLDWLFDRQPVAGAPGLSAFLQPVADQWRELLLRSLFYLAEQAAIPLPLLWLYPRNLPAIAHLSHDTDGNQPELAERLMEVLAEAEAPGTWCVILPGYTPEMVERIKQAGHELALHYDAMTTGLEWSETQFDRQFQELTALFGDPRPVSNKNHYLRWEGDTEFFEWCSRRGIQIDQSKGASKTGEAGFNFGTCHPYFPVCPDGSLLDVLELPTPTQDLGIFGPPSLLDPLLEAAARHHGVLHLLFHPAHIAKPGVAGALLSAVTRARQQGLEWWTARQINAWERARRQVRWQGYQHNGSQIQICLDSAETLKDATILWLTTAAAKITVNGEPVSAETVERWGFTFQSITFDAEQKAEIILRTTE